MRLSLLEYCLRFGKEDILKEWHTEKNGDIKQIWDRFVI